MQILPLTSARFFAAFYVVIYHTWNDGGRWLPIDNGGAVESFLHLGYVSVGFFFVLSGFILGKVYGKLEKQGGVRQYSVARIARIYPLYILSLLLDVPRLISWRIAKYGLAAGVSLTGATFVGQAVLLQAWIPQLSVLNFPSWSLSTEAFFYLVYPLCAGLVLRPRTAAALIGLLLLLWLARLIGPIMVELGEGGDFIRTVIGRNPILRLPDFIAGIVLCQVDDKLSALKRPPAKHHLVAIGAVALVVFGFTALIERDMVQRPIVEAALLPCFAALVLVLARGRGSISKVMSLGPLVILGEASYALYLLHVPVWYGFTLLVSVNSVGRYISYLFVVIALSIVSFFVLERPMRLWIRNCFSRYGRVDEQGR